MRRRDPHLGELAAALVDGELDAPERERALAHVARCDECRREVEAQRTLKQRLRTMSDPLPPAALTGRLADLAGAPARVRRRRPRHSGPAAPRRPGGPGGPLRSRPAGAAPVARSRRRRRPVYLLGLTATLVLGLGGLAYAVGGDTGGQPVVTPAVASYVEEHAATTGRLPLVDPGLVPAVSVAESSSGSQP